MYLSIPADDWVGQAFSEGRLAPGVARPQHVEAHPGNDRGQPAAEVLDLTRAGSAEAQPGVLNRVVGLRERTQHPVRNRPSMGSVLLEAIRQPVLLVHPVTFLRSHVSEKSP